MIGPHIQAVADIRDNAMSLIKIFGGDPHLSADTRAMREIQRLSEEVIVRGPREFHFLLEETASYATVEAERRQGFMVRGGGNG